MIQNLTLYDLLQEAGGIKFLHVQMGKSDLKVLME